MEHPSSSPAVCRDVARVSLSLILPPRPSADPFVALAEQWERQATSLETLSAAVGGAQGVNAAAALLRENAHELRLVLARKGGH